MTGTMCCNLPQPSATAPFRRALRLVAVTGLAGALALSLGACSHRARPKA